MKCRRCGGRLVGTWCTVHGEQSDHAEPPPADVVVDTPSARFWPADDLDFLRRHYEVLNCKELAIALGRTESGVKHMLARLGIRKPIVRRARAKPKPSRRDRWTPKELADLEDGELSFLTHRTEAAVSRQANRIGAGKRDDGRFSIREVAGMYDLHPEIVRRMVTSGQIPAERVGNSMRIEPDDAAVVPSLRKARLLNDGHRGWWKRD